MSSCAMNNQDSDEEVDLEALRLAALKSRKTKYGPRVNHNNLIPIVPISIENPEFIETKIKKEKISPTPEDNRAVESKIDGINKENEEDKVSNFSDSTFENDQDILSVDDKEEEDSLERLMDQLEAEISGKAPLLSNRIVLSSKTSNSERKEKKKKFKKIKNEADDEIELVQVKSGKEPGAVIEIRESASPENPAMDSSTKKSESSLQRKSPNRRSRSNFRSRSRSPFSIGRGYRRSRSPYWLKSPRRSRSPFCRSRSPFWLSRRSRSSSRKSRSPFRRYRSPNRKRSSYLRYSRSRSKSFDRRRSPWSLSPRRRSKSPFYRDGSPFFRRRNFNSPGGRARRSFSPIEGSKSPRRKSKSPRRFTRNSPFRRSKSPFRRSKSPLRKNKSSPRRSHSPFLRRSKSPISKLNSPSKRPLGRRSKTPARWSISPGRRPKSSDRSSKNRSKSPVKKSELSRKSPRRRLSKDGRSLSFSASPTPRRNRSPLRVVEKNKMDSNEKSEKPKDRNRNEKGHRSLSRENNKAYDRRPYRQRNFRRYSPSRGRKSSERQTKASRSPKQNQNSQKSKEETSNKSVKPTRTSPVPSAPPDPVLEARKKKFENLNEVDPTVDKKISLKSIKESSENLEDDEDALTINLEGNLWDESEESGDEFESRFKSGDTRKNRTVVPNRTVLSFRNLSGEGDSANRKLLLNKPLIEENRRDKFGRGDRLDRYQGKRNGRNDVRRTTNSETRRNKFENPERNKSKVTDKNGSQNTSKLEKRSDRRPIVWSRKDDAKPEKTFKESEVSTTHGNVKEDKSKDSEKKISDNKDKIGKEETFAHEADDFDKLISDFEKELESDVCLTTKVNSTDSIDQCEVKRRKISVKQDLFEPKVSAESTIKKATGTRTIKISESTSNKTDINFEETNKFIEEVEKVDLENSRQDGPEDYIEDDDFVLEVSARRKKSRTEEEDNQSDLRAVLSRRRNERLTKAVNLQENMPTRLVQSAFQGLGNKKSKRQERDGQESLELPIDKSVRSAGVERRRVLLLQREKNLSIATNTNLVPEVKPDTTIYQRFPRSNERRKRKLQRQQDPTEDMDQEEEEEGYEMEEEKQSRRFRLKRNVALSSQKS